MNYSLNTLDPFVLYCSYVNEKNCPPAKVKYNMRRVKWYEIELILWGEGHIITDGVALKASKGSIFFRKPGMVVQGISPYHCYLIVFDPFFEDYKLNLYSDADIWDTLPLNADKNKHLHLYYPDVLRLPNILSTMQLNKLEGLFSDCYNEFLYNRNELQFYLKTYLMHILLLIHNEIDNKLSPFGNKRSKQRNFQKVMSVRKHIDDNLSSSFTLDELALLSDLSPNFFCKVFKDITGDTVFNYIHKSKIVYAKRLILESDMTMKQISYTCGFENDTYFFNLFKRYEGMTPSEFRSKFKLYF